jgi:hypothetical protein
MIISDITFHFISKLIEILCIPWDSFTIPLNQGIPVKKNYPSFVGCNQERPVNEEIASLYDWTLAEHLSDP